MNQPMNERAGIVVAAVLAADGLLHLYWATGQIWPAHDARSLSIAVLGVDVPFKAVNVVPLAGMLLLGSATVLARVGRLGWPGRRLPDVWLRRGVLVVAAGLALRGLAGIPMAASGLGDRTFFLLNLALYTPLCLVLAAAALAAARSSAPDSPHPAASRRPSPELGRGYK